MNDIDSSFITYRWVHCHSIELSIVMQDRMFVNCVRRRSTVFQLLSHIGKLIQSINHISVRCVEKDSIRKVNMILLVTNSKVVEPNDTTLLIPEPTIAHAPTVVWFAVDQWHTDPGPLVVCVMELFVLASQHFHTHCVKGFLSFSANTIICDVTTSKLCEYLTFVWHCVYKMCGFILVKKLVT